MTSIKLKAAGAKATAEVSGVLTAGAMGIPVEIECDSSWADLTRNLLCTSGKWGPTGKAWAIQNVDGSATVAHEVMIAGNHLYLGIEGRNSDGTKVIPTTWADCGKICSSVSMRAVPSAKPTLPVWAQIQREINHLKSNGTASFFVRTEGDALIISTDGGN